MKKALILLLIFLGTLLVFYTAGSVYAASSSTATGSFWTPEMNKLIGALGFCLLLMVLLPMFVHVVDEQLGYFFLLLGSVILVYAISLGVVEYEHGYFVQPNMPHQAGFKEHLTTLKDFDTYFKKNISAKEGSELSDVLNDYLKEIKSKDKEKDLKIKKAYVKALKSWLLSKNVSLVEEGTKISLSSTKDKDPEGEENVKSFLYGMHVERLEKNIHHSMDKLRAENQKSFKKVLEDLLGKENVTEEKVKDEEAKHHGISIVLNKEAKYSPNLSSKLFQVAQLYVMGTYTEGHPHHLMDLIKEPWMLLLCFFSLSILSIIFESNIKNFCVKTARKVKPDVMVFVFVLVVGSLGSISVVVIATVGGIFFGTLSKITRRNYTIPVICFSANIGISALLTTVGEPLSLFVARNLGEGTPYLLKTFTVAVIINSIVIAFIAWFFAIRAPELEKTSEEKFLKEISDVRKAEVAVLKEVKEAGEALNRAKSALKNTTNRKNLEETGVLEAIEKFEKESNQAFDMVENLEKESKEAFKAIEKFDKESKEALDAAEKFEEVGKDAVDAVEEFETEQHNFAHELDRVLHATAKLAFFVWGLLFFGEGVKPIAAYLVKQYGDMTLFFANAISAVADNALLGLLEIQAGTAQITVFTLTLSLAFWGVAMVPGNVCNIVLKEALHIKFADWAKYGIPLAIVLCAINFVVVYIAKFLPMLFFPFGS